MDQLLKLNLYSQGVFKMSILHTAHLFEFSGNPCILVLPSQVI